ncbi:hypothetical protein PVAP13_4KG031758 [Panicum virgatum]|uniref:Uncharacterized protein n=1 Tax=Panicum virgatum TaxID=38727 RepID=A0A8T0TI94_PANVG|nr:hypothetical protein PVAP13_4KG031758 [Panicum virgatum]
MHPWPSLASDDPPAALSGVGEPTSTRPPARPLARALHHGATRNTRAPRPRSAGTPSLVDEPRTRRRGARRRRRPCAPPRPCAPQPSRAGAAGPAPARTTVRHAPSGSGGAPRLLCARPHARCSRTHAARTTRSVRLPRMCNPRPGRVLVDSAPPPPHTR